MEPFDRLSRGRIDAETLGKPFYAADRDFWKGAPAGSAAALALSNLPALKAAFGAMEASAASAGTPEARADAQDEKDDSA